MTEEQQSFSEGDAPSLLHLPDLALHMVCLQLSDPFDVLSLGATCRRLHQLTSSESLWTRIALSWCQGMWHCLPIPLDQPQPENPKQWLLQLLRLCGMKQNLTLNRCKFENGETWERIHSGRFASKVAMLSCTYKAVDERVSPFVLLRRWLYDVALYWRQNPAIRFHDKNLHLRQQCVSELAALGRARQGDLRGRKQPNIDPRYYVAHIGTSSGTWTQDLFPSGPSGSICPLLACPSEAGYSVESSGIDGLVTCVSYVLGKHIEQACLERHSQLAQMASMVRQACAALERMFSSHTQEVRARWPTCPVAHAVFSMAKEGWPDLASWQVHLDTLGLQWRDIMTECAALLRKHETLDAIVDKARIRWRHALLPEIEAALGCTNGGTVTRLNLTDCDVIGGDNSRQEMAAAAFVSPSGVLVTWQLLGRGSY